MKSVSLDGVEYIKATELAKEYGYTNDYIGQLCRANKVQAHLVGRTWYVLPESLRQHKKGRYRSNQKKTLETVRSDVQEAVSHQQKNNNEMRYKTYVGTKNIAYSQDEQELIPQVRKVAVLQEGVLIQPQTPAKELPVDATEQENDLEVEVAQPRKSGVITVTEDTSTTPEFAQQSVTLITPHIIRKTPQASTNQTQDRRSSTIEPATELSVVDKSEKISTPSNISPFIRFAGPVAISMFVGLAFASLLVGLSWHIESTNGVTEQTYIVNMSTAIQSIFGLK